VLFEVGLSLAVVVGTGFWSSPYVFCLATAILAAGFARGFGFALRTATAAVVAVAVPYHLQDPAARLVVTMQWGAELFLVGIIAGYARRLFGEAEEHNVLARQANELLAQLHEVAQTLPTSLDLEETVTQAVADVRALVNVDVIAVLLRDAPTESWTVALVEGMRLPTVISDGDLPAPAANATRDTRTVHVTAPRTASFFADDAQAGAYIPLLARSRLTGMLVIESLAPEGITAADVAHAEAIGHRAALALDNARWFTMLRRVGADEERTRIARDLHDRVGQSLAFVGFELDRIGRAAVGQPVEDDLVRLRDEVRRVVAEVRDTLYDLRTDVSERQDLGSTLETFLDRVSERTGIRIDLDQEQSQRLPLRQERELWRIAQEAVANACRHALPRSIWVRWYCDGAHALLEVRDDGRGMPSTDSLRPDAYGLRGMRERAASIGGRLAITAAEGGGTLVRCEVGP
jgi:signal transduction histidine kinase